MANAKFREESNYKNILEKLEILDALSEELKSNKEQIHKKRRIKKHAFLAQSGGLTLLFIAWILQNYLIEKWQSQLQDQTLLRFTSMSIGTKLDIAESGKDTWEEKEANLFPDTLGQNASSIVTIDSTNRYQMYYVNKHTKYLYQYICDGATDKLILKQLLNINKADLSDEGLEGYLQAYGDSISAFSYYNKTHNFLSMQNEAKNVREWRGGLESHLDLETVNQFRAQLGNKIDFTYTIFLIFSILGTLSLGVGSYKSYKESQLN